MTLEDLIPMELDAPAAPAPAAPVAAPVVEPAAAPVEPAPVVAVPTAEPEPPADPNQRAIHGLTSELRAERAERQRWQEAAQNGIQLAQRLQSRPDLLQALTAAPEPPAAPPPPTFPDHQLREMAESMQLFGADGKPDKAAAARVLQYAHGVAEQAAEAAVQKHVRPMEAQRTQDRAVSGRAEADQVARQLGIPDDLTKSFFDGLLQTNPEIFANQQTAATAILTLNGLHAVQKGQGGGRAPAPAPAAAAPLPTFVEGGGSRPAPVAMSNMETRAAKRAGISVKDWMKISGDLAAMGPQKLYQMEDD